MNEQDLVTRKPEDAYWGVGCIIINSNKEILHIKRTDNFQWGTPGGKVDPNETVLQAVYREVKEEVGLDIINPKCIGDFFTYHENEGGKFLWRSFVFVCEFYIGDIKLQKEECSEYKWLNVLDALENYDLFQPSLQSINYLKQLDELWMVISEPNIMKMTSMEQLTSIKEPGTNGGKGHYDSNGKWVYDKPNKPTNYSDKLRRMNERKDPEGILKPPQQNSNQIESIKQSYINYYSRYTGHEQEFKKLYQVKDGKFVFPDYNTAKANNLIKDKESYRLLFNEQYMHFALTNGK